MEKDAMGEIMQNPPVKKTYRNNFLQKIDEIVEEGENAKIMNVNIRLFNLGDIDLHDEVAVHERLAEYFRIYAEADMKPTVAGMGTALGLDRRRLWEIKNDKTQGRGDIDTLPKGVRDSIKKAYMVLENMWETYMNSGKINPVSGIFLGKNNFGYQDKTEYVVTPNVQQETDFNEEDIRKRYLTDSAAQVEITEEE